MSTPEHTDPLTGLVVSFQHLPSETVLSEIAPYFQKIAWHYAGKITRHREDRQDYTQDIIAYMLEVLSRPITHTQARYNPAKGTARGFFESVARTKAWNIGSANMTRHRNLDQPISHIIDYGAFTWLDYDYE